MIPRKFWEPPRAVRLSQGEKGLGELGTEPSAWSVETDTALKQGVFITLVPQPQLCSWWCVFTPAISLARDLLI